MDYDVQYENIMEGKLANEKNIQQWRVSAGEKESISYMLTEVDHCDSFAETNIYFRVNISL